MLRNLVPIPIDAIGRISSVLGSRAFRPQKWRLSVRTTPALVAEALQQGGQFFYFLGKLLRQVPGFAQVLQQIVEFRRRFRFGAFWPWPIRYHQLPLPLP